jgi:H+/gluconate symporter-like permease
MDLLGILLGLGLLIWLAFRGWSILLLAPAAALLAAAAAGEPLLAHWTQTFMGSAAGFLCIGLDRLLVESNPQSVPPPLVI